MTAPLVLVAKSHSRRGIMSNGHCSGRSKTWPNHIDRKRAHQGQTLHHVWQARPIGECGLAVGLGQLLIEGDESCQLRFQVASELRTHTDLWESKDR
jgi:hypothetical protein